MPGPLSGYRIIDMTTVIMGPMASMMMGEMGADVIKIESPAGDQTRNYAQGKTPGMGSIYMNLNKNKRSVMLDLKQPAGRDALLRLLEGADVLLYSIRPQAMDRLGLGYDACRAVNPKLIYCGAYGFRQDGPYAARPAYDDIIQGLCGTASNLTWITDEPRLMPAMNCDKTTGLYVVQAVIAALLHRERSGEAQAVEVPMFESNVHFNLMEHWADMIYDPPAGPAGYSRAKLPNRKPFKTKDGYLCILPGSTKHWVNFFTAVGRDDLAADPRVSDPALRYQNADEFYRTLASIVAEWETEALRGALEKADVPCGPIYAYEDLPNDPHLKAVGYFQDAVHPTEGPLKVPDIPVRFSASPGGQSRPAPAHGEHSAELLREVGYSDDEIAAMAKSGATAEKA